MSAENGASGAGRDHPPTARRAPLAIDPDEFRRAGHALVDQIADFLGSLPERSVTPGQSPDTVRAALRAGDALPDEGADPQQLLRETADLLFDHSLFNGHAKFFGYVTSSPAPIGMLGDLLAAAVNPNVGAWALSPMATEIEAQTVRWMAEMIGYPTDCGGLFVSGGNMANFVGFVAARAAAAGPGVRQSGFAGGLRPRIYASSETHTWIQKAADLFGGGTESIRWIETDAQQRMDVGRLRRAIATDREAGDLPMIVVGTAGTVSTGAIDPLFDIADACREAGVWFHVDGAYGGFAAVLPDAPHDLGALALADSVAVDPHKWLYAPLEAGCVLVRDQESLRAAFSYHPPYYHFGTEAINYFDFGMQNSRGFRALKVWLALRQVGRRGYEQMIGEDIRLSRQLYEAAAAEPELEALTQSLSITTFRYVPADLRDKLGTPAAEAYLNELNEKLLDRLQRSGEAFVSNAVIGGRYCLRACIVNFRTGPEDVGALPGIVVRHGRALHEPGAEPRSEDPPSGPRTPAG
jgi:aromatic-L-amino-acid/L-tryptophan decarboxylase